VLNGRLIKRPQDDNQLQKGSFFNISDALFSSERRSRVFSVEPCECSMTAEASRADSWLLDLIMFRLLCGSQYCEACYAVFFPQ
jgi:hypothetical protein